MFGCLSSGFLFFTHLFLIDSAVIMKLSLSALFLLAVGVIAEKKVSYDGAKAIRIEVGEDVTSVMNIISQLKLETWKGVVNGVPVAGGHVDLVVPASKVAKFNKLAEKIKTEVMHEDLGASIAEESAPTALSSRGMLMFLSKTGCVY